MTLGDHLKCAVVIFLLYIFTHDYIVLVSPWGSTRFLYHEVYHCLSVTHPPHLTHLLHFHLSHMTVHHLLHLHCRHFHLLLLV